MDFKADECLKKDLIDLYSSDSIELIEEKVDKIIKIFEKHYRNSDNTPFGEIEISVKGSRSRIGTTLIARAIYTELKKCGYKVIFNFVNYKGENLDYICASDYTLSKKSFKDLINPRANITIKSYE